MFPKHDDFAVRNLGLPGMIGALGACFGRVVTLDSPHARPPGEYNWQPTLWHELAHVVTLQLSNNRVPRWLTEGISVWEERRGRPEWGREMERDRSLAPWIRSKVMKLSALNEGLQRSRDDFAGLPPGVAGRRASRGRRTARRRSPDCCVRTAAASRRMRQSRKCSRPVAGRDPDVASTRSSNVNTVRCMAALKPPAVKTHADTRRSEAAGRRESREFPGADVAGQGAGGGRAIPRVRLPRSSAPPSSCPAATGDDNPNKMIAAIAMAQKNNARAVTALEAVLKVDHADVDAARQLIPLAWTLHDPAPDSRTPTSVWSTSIPFEASSHARWAGWRYSARTRRRRQGVPHGAGDETAGSCDARRSGRGLSAGPSTRRREDAGARGSGDCPVLRACAGPAACVVVDGAADSASSTTAAGLTVAIPAFVPSFPRPSRSRRTCAMNLDCGASQCSSIGRSSLGIVPPLDPLPLGLPEHVHADDACDEPGHVRPERDYLRAPLRWRPRSTRRRSRTAAGTRSRERRSRAPR